jgi:hypothetical protein
MMFRRGRGRAQDLHVGDATYDDWAVVRDFEDLETAMAFRDSLRDSGIRAVLTADWPLDEYRRGDIALRVEGADYGDAEVLLSGLDDD